jgi:hypothetical protein
LQYKIPMFWNKLNYIPSFVFPIRRIRFQFMNLINVSLIIIIMSKYISQICVISRDKRFLIFYRCCCCLHYVLL